MKDLTIGNMDKWPDVLLYYIAGGPERLVGTTKQIRIVEHAMKKAKEEVARRKK